MNSVQTVKAEEIKQYRVFNAARTQKLELILPGLGSIAANKVFKGTFRLAVFSAGLVLVVTGGRIISSFIPTGFDITGFLRIMGIIVLGLIYFRSYKSPPLRYGA